PPQTHTLSLHDALPISLQGRQGEHVDARTFLQLALDRSAEQLGEDDVAAMMLLVPPQLGAARVARQDQQAIEILGDNERAALRRDRKSTRLNSSHVAIS